APTTALRIRKVRRSTLGGIACEMTSLVLASRSSTSASRGSKFSFSLLDIAHLTFQESVRHDRTAHRYVLQVSMRPKELVLSDLLGVAGEIVKDAEEVAIQIGGGELTQFPGL